MIHFSFKELTRKLNQARRKQTLQCGKRKELAVRGKKEGGSSNDSLWNLSEICNSLSSLHLVGCSLLSSQFFKDLQANKTLVELTLDDCELDNNLVSELADSLTRNTSLTKLDLSRNNCQFKGALRLSLMLKENKVIRDLNMSLNPLGPLGIMVIVASSIQCSGRYLILPISDLCCLVILSIY